MKAPKHFASIADFNRCILEWAINDRIAMLFAYDGCSSPCDLKHIQETRDEIKALREKLQKMNSKEYRKRYAPQV